MEINVTKDEITIKLAKKDHEKLFDRVPVMRDVKAYFEYLLNLDYQLNGDGSLLNGFQNLESFKESLSSMDDSEIKKVKEDLLSDLFAYVDYASDAIPEEYTFTSYDYDLVFISEDDTIAYLKYTADKLKALIGFENQEATEE